MVVDILRGARVLLIEDDVLIALLLEAELEAAGCAVVGPYPSVSTALQGLRDASPDVALLDVLVGNEESFAVAEALKRRDIPFVFATGRPIDNMPQRYRGRRFLMKPFQPEEMLAALADVLQEARAGAANG